MFWNNLRFAFVASQLFQLKHCWVLLILTTLPVSLPPSMFSTGSITATATIPILHCSDLNLMCNWQTKLKPFDCQPDPRSFQLLKTGMLWMKDTAVEEASCSTETSESCRTRNAVSETWKSAVLELTQQHHWKAEILVRFLNFFRSKDSNWNLFYEGGPMTAIENGTPTLFGINVAIVSGNGFRYMMSTRTSRFLQFVKDITGIPIR